MSALPASVSATLELLGRGQYVADRSLATAVYLALSLKRPLFLEGEAGTGKTELAKAFGRWFRDTGGVDAASAVHFYSFEPGIASFGLDGAIDALGIQVFGTDSNAPAASAAT